MTETCSLKTEFAYSCDLAEDQSPQKTLQFQMVHKLYQRLNIAHHQKVWIVFLNVLFHYYIYNIFFFSFFTLALISYKFMILSQKIVRDHKFGRFYHGVFIK